MQKEDKMVIIKQVEKSEKKVWLRCVLWSITGIFTVIVAVSVVFQPLDC